MTRHISNKDLAAQLAGTGTERTRSRVAKHLVQCDQCRARHDRIRAAMTPRYGALQASAAAKIRVMRSWEELSWNESSPAPSRIRSFLAIHPRTAIAVSLALAASIVMISVLLIRTPVDRPQPHLSAVQVDHGVTIDGRYPGEEARLYGGSVMSLPDKTMVRLIHDRNFSIVLIGPAVFSIKHFTPGNDARPMDIECVLDHGILISSSTGSITYAYTTPGARIEPVGTEFLLQAAGGKTLVVMKSGSVRVKPIQSAESVTVPAGSKCVVTEKAEVNNADPDDLKIFGRLDQLRAGVFNQRLLDPMSVNEDTKLHGERTVGPKIPRNDNNQRSLAVPEGKTTDKGNMFRRGPADNSAKPGLREQGRINKQKKLIRETRKTIRQQRRTSR